MSECAQNRPSRRTFAPFVEHWHGAATRVGVSETAFAHRKHQFNYILWSIWEDPADSDENIGWIGAKVKDSSGLLEGDYADGRRLAMFYDAKDVRSKEKALRAAVTRWLKLLKK